MNGWNISFLLGWPIFRGYVSFREGSRYVICSRFGRINCPFSLFSLLAHSAKITQATIPLRTKSPLQIHHPNNHVVLVTNQPPSLSIPSIPFITKGTGEKQHKYSVLARHAKLDSAVKGKGPMSQPKKRAGSFGFGDLGW